MADDTDELGRFDFVGIPSAPRGVPQIEVTFDIDANGILHVTAKDRATSREQKITITSSSGLAKEEVERLRQEAELHASDDQKKRELIEARNVADSLVYTSEKTLREAGDKIGADDRRGVEDAILKVKSSLTGEDPAAIKQATDELSAQIQKVGAAMYSSTDTKETETAAPDETANAEKKEADKEAEAAKEEKSDGQA